MEKFWGDPSLPTVPENKNNPLIFSKGWPTIFVEGIVSILDFAGQGVSHNYSALLDCIVTSPYPWRICSKTPSRCQTLHILCFSLYIHAYDKV